MTDEQLDDYPRRLLLDLAFESKVKPADISHLTVVMSGANDGQPAQATFVVSSSWQASLGYRSSTPVSDLGFESATVETADGASHDVLPALKEAIGRIPRNFGVGDSVGDLCGGF
jgi:hypothetical protein